MQKKHKNIIIISMMLGVLLWGVIGQKAYALTPPEVTTEKTSLTLEYEYKDILFSDVEVNIYCVALWKDSTFVLTDSFADSKVTLEFSHTPSASQWRDMGLVLEKYIDKKGCKCQGSIHTDTKGIATFSNLENGVYYVEIEDTPYEKGTLVSDPIIVTVPFYEGTTNSWDYKPRIEPKVAFVEKPDKPDKPHKPDTPDKPDKPDEKPKVEIPQTGTWSWLVTPLAFAGVLLFLVGFLGISKRGQEKDEKKE